MHRSTTFSLGLLLCGGVLSTLVELPGCASSGPPAPRGLKFQYTYSMLQPEQTATLSFADPGFEIDFQIDEGAIGFKLRNTSDSPLTLDWPHASLAVGNKSSAVRHSANYGVDSSLELKDVVVPVDGVIRDFVLPREHLVRRGGKIIELDLFPTADLNSLERRKLITSNVGKRLALAIPVEVSGVKKNYVFEFQISSVHRVLWKNYLAPHRTPIEPPKKLKPSTIDVAVAVAITAGIVGLAAVVVTSQKEPRTD